MSRVDNGMLELLGQPMGVAEARHYAATMDTDRLCECLSCDNERVARNAAWVLTHKSTSDIRRLPQQPLVELVLATSCVPLRRLVLALVERQEIKEEGIRTDFLDFCLQHFVMLEEPPGVQALCLKLAYRMCVFYPELTHELKETLDMVHPECYKPGMRSQINKIKQLIG